MTTILFSPRSCLIAMICCCLFGRGGISIGAEQNNTNDITAKAEDTNQNQQTLRSYLQLQEQLHETLLTIERNRKENEAAAKANTEALSQRLEAIEQSLGTQRNHEANLLQNSNRVTLIAAGVFAALGLVAMVFTAWFLLRAMNRLAPFATALPARAALVGGLDGALINAEGQLMDIDPVEPSSNRLLGALERLEKRVNELEHTSRSVIPENQSGTQNGSSPGEGAHANGIPDQIAVILGKGQSLLSLNKAEEAIACFDKALGLDPKHAEAFVKKGMALERLEKLEEAIECYDQAIAANSSLTVAYLYKGSVCNQLERFNEALDCYEQALRNQKKAASA